MRKRTVKYTADIIFWYILYLLPLIYGLISMYCLMRNEQYMAEWIVYVQGMDESLDEGTRMLWGVMFELFNESVFYLNPVYTVLYELFGEVGILPLFEFIHGVDILCMVSYFVSVYLVHLAVDFLLFIPRLCHKWMNAFTRGEE